MPLSKLQSQILRLLAAHRDPESYVAGSTPLPRGALRSSDDIDIFHDREERVALAAAEDTKILQAEGLKVRSMRREPAIHTAEIPLYRIWLVRQAEYRNEIQRVQRNAPSLAGLVKTVKDCQHFSCFAEAKAQNQAAKS